MAETSSVVDMEGSKLVDFDVCQFGYQEGTNENDHELDAECKQNGQEMPEPKTTSRSENQHKNGRSRQVDKKGSATQ